MVIYGMHGGYSIPRQSTGASLMIPYTPYGAMTRAMTSFRARVRMQIVWTALCLRLVGRVLWRRFRDVVVYR